jgi:WD40 repeat protein/DNA-binding CsgD family transcriptional regulator
LHIVPLYDYWRDHDGAYLVMRWLRGGNLRDALVNGHFELEPAALFMDQITSALAMAHRNDVIHRDLKPANILLDEDGNTYLSDFGIAKDTAKVEGTLTGTGIVLGSPDYLSPEQARSEPVTPQTDIYSLGVMLYEVLTGQHPFPNLSSVERMYKHLNEPLPFIDSLPSEIADGVNAIIQRATAKNPAQRYADVLEMAADFRREADLSKRSPESIVEQLTLREQEILQMITDGCSNKDIAERLFVTVATVKWHIRQVYQKLHVRSRVQAIMRARNLNLIGSTPAATEPLPIESTYIVLPEPENPYKGLRAFQTADARDFFGREKLVQRLVQHLGERDRPSRFLAVVGPSGSGKSSAVKAGLVAALWRGDLPGSERWFVIEMMPGTHPLDELEIALTRVAANQANNLREHLERDARGLVRVAGLILPDDGSELVVMVDQFEEVFTLVEDEARRTQFLDLLHTAATDPRSRVRVIITLRADFYDRPLHYPEFGELVRTHMETVMPLSAEELEAAIACPAARVGVSFEPGLVATITGDVHYQPGALPLLQYALTELFEQRSNRTLTHETYQALGGASSALTRRAEELYHEQDEVGQETRRQMFLRLVTLGEGVEDTRRRVLRSELLAVGENEDLMDEAIDTYAAYRLLTLDHDPVSRSSTDEIAHEAILREWDRLRAWLNESRYDIQQQRLLGAASADWQQGGQDKSYLLHGTRLQQIEAWAAETELALTQHERAFLDTCIAERDRQEAAEHERQAREVALKHRAQRVLQLLVGVFLLAAVIGIGLAIFAFDRERQAQDARARAEQQAAVNHSLVLANGAEDQFVGGQTELGLLLALESINIENPPIEAERALRTVALGTGIRAILRGHTLAVQTVAFSPDERFAVSTSCSQDDGSGCVRGELILWDLQAETELHRFLGHEGIVTDGIFTPDGQGIWSASSDGQIILWDANPDSASFGAMLNHYNLDHGRIHDIALCGNMLLAGTDEGVVSFDVATGTPTQIFEQHASPVTTLVASPDGQNVLSGSENSLILLWNLDTGEIIQQFEGHNKPISQVAFHPTLPRIVSASEDATFRVWDLNTGVELGRYQTPTFIDDFSLSVDGNSAIVDGGGGAIPILDMNTLQVSTYLLNSPDGQTIGADQQTHSITSDSRGLNFMTGHEDGSIVLWNFAFRRDIHHFQIDSVPGGFVSTEISPNGKRMITGPAEGGAAILWDIDPNSLHYGEALAHLGSYQGSVLLASFSPDGRYALVGSADYFGETGAKSLILWNVDENSDQFGQPVYTLEGFNLLPRSSTFTPDGSRILAGTSVLEASIGELLMWDAATGNLLHQFDINHSIAGILITPDGKRALTAHNGTNLIVEWDIDPESPDFGSAIRQIETVGYVFDLAWSPDVDSFLAAETGSELIERDYVTGVIRRRLNGLGLAIWSVEVNDQYVIAGNEQGEIAVWDYESGTQVWLSPKQESLIFDLSVSPDNQYAYSVALTGNPVQWRIGEPTLDELLAWIHNNRYIREFTCEERAQYRIEPLCK